MYWIDPAVLLWLLPVTAPLILSIPLSVYSSRPSLGRVAKRWRLFQIPEESSPPPVVAAAQTISERRRAQDFPGGGFIYTVLDRWANRLHVGLLRRRTAKSPQIKKRNQNIREAAVKNGLAALSSSEKAHLLKDAESMSALHYDFYQTGDVTAAVPWRVGNPDAPLRSNDTLYCVRALPAKDLKRYRAAQHVAARAPAARPISSARRRIPAEICSFLVALLSRHPAHLPPFHRPQSIRGKDLESKGMRAKLKTGPSAL